MCFIIDRSAAYPSGEMKVKHKTVKNKYWSVGHTTSIPNSITIEAYRYIRGQLGLVQVHSVDILREQ